MCLGITMLAMVQNIECAAAEENGVFDFDMYPSDAQDLARARMARLDPLCTDAAGLWVRTQSDGGNKKDAFLLRHGAKKRFTLRQ